MRALANARRSVLSSSALKALDFIDVRFPLSCSACRQLAARGTPQSIGAFVICGEEDIRAKTSIKESGQTFSGRLPENAGIGQCPEVCPLVKRFESA